MIKRKDGGHMYQGWNDEGVIVIKDLKLVSVG